MAAMDASADVASCLRPLEELLTADEVADDLRLVVANICRSYRAGGREKAHEHKEAIMQAASKLWVSSSVSCIFVLVLHASSQCMPRTRFYFHTQNKSIGGEAYPTPNLAHATLRQSALELWGAALQGATLQVSQQIQVLECAHKASHSLLLTFFCGKTHRG